MNSISQAYTYYQDWERASTCDTTGADLSSQSSIGPPVVNQISYVHSRPFEDSLHASISETELTLRFEATKIVSTAEDPYIDENCSQIL